MKFTIMNSANDNYEFVISNTCKLQFHRVWLPRLKCAFDLAEVKRVPSQPSPLLCFFATCSETKTSG